MRRFVRCVAVVSAAGALACTEAPAPVAPSRTISLNTSNASKELIPGEYIVVLNPAVQDVSVTVNADGSRTFAVQLELVRTVTIVADAVTGAPTLSVTGDINGM